MRRLMVVCSCGERIQVPQSALGKMGLCPGCGQTIAITKESAVAVKSPTAPTRSLGRAVNCPECGHAFTVGGEAQTPEAVRQEALPYRAGQRPTEDSKRRFAEAVDLYFNRRYAESLVIFNDLALQYPGNADIDAARQQCVQAMNVARGLVLEHRPDPVEPPKPQPSVVRVERPAAPPARKAADLNPDTLKQVLLEKMINGSSEEIQMRATELAFKLIERETRANGEDIDALSRILEEAPRADTPEFRLYRREEEAQG